MVDDWDNYCGLFLLFVPPVPHLAQMKTPQSLERGVFIGGERGT